MKKNLQLTVLALALCCVTINAQNSKVKTGGSNTNNQTAVNSNGNSSGVFDGARTRGCGTKAPGAEWDSWFNKEVEKFVAQNATGKNQMATYVIPVIFHIIHTGQASGTYPNLNIGQINSQLTVLNQDYASAGLNVGSLPAVFTPAKANTNVSFCMAMINPTGGALAEPGVDRIACSSKGWANPTSFGSSGAFQTFIDGTVKPNSIWDPTRYFNVWVTDCASAVGLLGYATFPIGTGLTGITGNGTATTDGVWCYSAALGSSSIFAGGTYAAPYDKGRTLIHEAGHWLGLRHIWGDGTCATDYCNDTPSAQTANYGCPTHPFNVGVCSGNTTGEMFQNFMDYTDDACMYIFTNDQRTRIQTAMSLGTYRSQLSAASVTNCVAAAPAAPVTNFSIAASACKLNPVSTINNTTGNPSPTYSWSTLPSAGVTFNPNSTSTNPSITFATAGTYTVRCVSTNSLGSSPQTKVITVNSCSAACNDTLKTLWAGGNGQSGNFFDLTNTATGPIQIISFDQCFNVAGTLTMEIYYKTGTYVGSEATPGNWTLAGSAPVTAATASVPVAIPVTLTVSIPAGGTEGFYITTTSGSNIYTNGTNQGGVYTSKYGLQFKEGKGVAYPFGATFGVAPASRIWNGVIHFCNPLITGINNLQINESENVVYPNPNSGSVNVNLSPLINVKDAAVKVYDMFGRLVYTQSNINTNNFTVEHNLASGFYILQVENENKIVLNKKISVQK